MGTWINCPGCNLPLGVEACVGAPVRCPGCGLVMLVGAAPAPAAAEAPVYSQDPAPAPTDPPGPPAAHQALADELEALRDAAPSADPALPGGPPSTGLVRKRPPWLAAALHPVRHGLAAAYAVAFCTWFAIVMRGDWEIARWCFSDSGLGPPVLFLAFPLALLAAMPRPGSSRPFLPYAGGIAILAAALMAAAVSAGLLAVVFGVFALFGRMPDNYFSFFGSGGLQTDSGGWMWILSICLAAWLFIFGAVWSDKWPVKCRQINAWLIAGSVLLVAAASAVDLPAGHWWSDSYPHKWTYISLRIGITVLLCSLAPALVRLYLAPRLQQLADSGLCAACGYDLRGLTKARCPECGTPFEPVKTRHPPILPGPRSASPE